MTIRPRRCAMAEVPPRDVLRKVRKLALLPQEVRQSRWAVSITRLTVLKSLCQEPDRAKLPDSFRYYGPNGLWYKWNARGRDFFVMFHSSSKVGLSASPSAAFILAPNALIALDNGNESVKSP